MIVKLDKWDEHLTWSSHWSGQKNKIKCEYAEKQLYAKIKKKNGTC